jgi:Ca2+-transporting ATPase
MVFKGTNVVAGNGVAVVVSTGAETEVGRIAKNIVEYEAEIPLQANIRYLSRLIIIVVAVIATAMFLLGVAKGFEVTQMFTTVVSLTVSVIPEGLPIVMTLVLATGVMRMSKRHALVKRLQAVEALGQARIIAVDKTGTLTRNELVVQKVYAGGRLFEVEGSGYEPSGTIMLNGKKVVIGEHPELHLAASISGLSATARVVYSEAEKRWLVSGDPTEAAMLVFAEKAGLQKGVLETNAPLVCSTLRERPRTFCRRRAGSNTGPLKVHHWDAGWHATFRRAAE